MFDTFYIQISNNLDNWKKLKSRFPIAKRVKSFKDAQELALTNFFWVVWEDLIVNEHFTFDYVPDLWSQDYIHVFKNGEHSDGIVLVPKIANVTDKEISHRFFINKKEVNIIASCPERFEIYNISTYQEYTEVLKNVKHDMFWMSSTNISVDQTLVDNFYISYHEQIDRKQNHAFIHRVDEIDHYNGLFLCSKHRPLTQREVDYRHIVNKKEWNIVGSTKKSYDVFEIDSYNDYLTALEISTTEMFWMSSKNISATIPDMYFTHDNEYDRKQNHAFIHRVDEIDHYNGLFLCSKHRPLTQREVDYRHIVNKKEWNIVGSGPIKYEIFNVKTYQDYLDALANSRTEMFWIIPVYVNQSDRFNFDTYFTHDKEFERKINHTYLNGKYHDGIILCSKYARFSKREFDYKFIANKKETNIIISMPKPYDIVFISYQEPYADMYYKYLTYRFPRARRVHGVKGIHQAHIEAAKLCETDMFWIVDGDALVMKDFKFDYQVPRWDKEMVHVWRSLNPINDLVYGYGGIKLFPTELTINMDTSKPDMTTSISSKFKAVQELSNTTGFNTDPFNTWKSAFRECTKLSSKVIDRQKDTETQNRLQVWCTVGKDRPYGEYAIDGAKQGTLYGANNKDNIELLKKINDFEWLKEQFDARNI